jgi:large subunit ribosomal protein L15
LLQSAGLVKKGRNEIKVLGHGELTVALTVRAHKFTKTALQKIESAGGKAETIGK